MRDIGVHDSIILNKS